MAGRSDTPAPLDATDRALVALLAEDGRMSVNELAARANVSRATAYARFERLRRDGVVTGFSATVSPEALGLGLTALVLAHIDQGKWEEAREHLFALPGVEYLAFTSGEFDVVLLVRVHDIAALRDVVLQQLHGLPFVRSTRTIFVLDEHRRHLAADA
jgi:DNA-binding Lrp family transcriptional regulator